MKARKAADDCRIIREAAVAVNLSEVFEQALYKIERIRTLRMARELHALERRPRIAVLFLVSHDR